LYILLFITLVIVVCRLLWPLPSLNGRVSSYVLPNGFQTELGKVIENEMKKWPGKTGIEPLVTGEHAFATRILLAQQAQLSIDAQYYIWHNDLTGMLLLDALKAAAERGVRVRLLVDDNGTSSLDQELAYLNNLPNFEVRSYNPFTIRSPRLFGYVFDFFRLNHRMHNKTFTIDNVATVIGGRNVGDEYFGTGTQPLFIDLDVLGVGAIVKNVSSDFDRYWNSQSAYPVHLLTQPKDDASEIFDKRLRKLKTSDEFDQYAEAIQRSQIVKKLAQNELSLEWVNVQLISDDPVKTLGEASGEQLMVNQLSQILGQPSVGLDLVSPYFVPGKKGMEFFKNISAKGVKIRVLTNSIEATDVVVVHSGYAKYREKILKLGIQLFELKAQAEPEKHTHKDKNKFIGSSGSSLHAKTFAVDDKRIFIGSFNFDPRSALLNTELGFVIESSELAQAMNNLFDKKLSEASYISKLDKNGNLIWLDHTVEGGEGYQIEPGSTLLERIALKVLGWLPIEWLL